MVAGRYPKPGGESNEATSREPKARGCRDALAGANGFRSGLCLGTPLRVSGIRKPAPKELHRQRHTESARARRPAALLLLEVRDAGDVEVRPRDAVGHELLQEDPGVDGPGR